MSITEILDQRESVESGIGAAPRRWRSRRPRLGPAQRMPILDAITLVLGVAVAHFAAQLNDSASASFGWNVTFVAIVMAALAMSGVYRERFALHLIDDVRTILGATALAAMGITFVGLLGDNDAALAVPAARMWLFGACYLVGGRAAYSWSVARARRNGAGGGATLIVGAGAVGRMVAKRLVSRPEFGLRPVAFLDEHPVDSPDELDLPVLGAEAGFGGVRLAEKVSSAIRDHGIDHVILAFSLASHEEELLLLRSCRRLGASVSLVPRLFEGVPDQTQLERLGGIPLVCVHARDPQAWQFTLKYAVDRVFAALLILVASPLMAAAALGVLISLGRPVLFSQERVGLDGVPFSMLKFRTMRGMPEEAGEADADWAAEVLNSARVEVKTGAPIDGERQTRLGALLRRWGVDELPQLFNVLKGEMSLVGPRPERLAYASEFERAVERYDDRHRVKAGITGWAQVHGLRGKTSLQDRIEWDNYYVENWSPWLDFKTIILTAVELTRSARR